MFLFFLVNENFPESDQKSRLCHSMNSLSQLKWLLKQPDQKILDVVDEQTIRIDGTGKHITAGLIDEHSHIAIKRGVNEGSHAVSAEVRIGDVINPEDINIYRQIAGGVTTSQLLHGSANPIGGQSAIIKLRWGANSNEMKFKNASKFIKFAHFCKTSNLPKVFKKRPNPPGKKQ